MTIKEIMGKGITKIRLPVWVNPNAHLKLDKFEDGTYGPWAHLFDEWGQRALGLEIGSQEVLIYELKETNWEEFKE